MPCCTHLRMGTHVCPPLQGRKQQSSQLVRQVEAKPICYCPRRPSSLPPADLAPGVKSGQQPRGHLSPIPKHPKHGLRWLRPRPVPCPLVRNVSPTPQGGSIARLQTRADSFSEGRPDYTASCKHVWARAHLGSGDRVPRMLRTVSEFARKPE